MSCGHPANLPGQRLAFECSSGLLAQITITSPPRHKDTKNTNPRHEKQTVAEPLTAAARASSKLKRKNNQPFFH